MVLIEIKQENLEYIKQLSEISKTEFRYPIYFEYNDGNPILLTIQCGKYVNYFSHANVIIPKNMKISNIKLIKEFINSELTSDGISKAIICTNIDINSFIKNEIKEEI